MSEKVNETGLASAKRCPAFFLGAGFEAAVDQIPRLAAAICGSIAASRLSGWAESGLLSTFQVVSLREKGFSTVSSGGKDPDYGEQGPVISNDPR